MHGPYPGELRLRVIDFVEGGGSRRGAAEQFEVSVSSQPGSRSPLSAMTAPFADAAARSVHSATASAYGLERYAMGKPARDDVDRPRKPVELVIGATFFMFIAGAGTLPGTFAGSFLLNLWVGYSIRNRQLCNAIALACPGARD
jgi:hypothetical protein